MNARMKRRIYEEIRKIGFLSKNKSFFLISNDVVQGFCFKEKRISGTVCLSISFAVYPLCNPFSNYYRFSFERREIGILMPQFSLWPFSYHTTDSLSQDCCTEALLKSITELLVPYFNSYQSCALASSGIPELCGHNNATLDSVFFALKAAKKDVAIDGLTSILVQHKLARQKNVGNMPGELCQMMTERSIQKDKQIQELLFLIHSLPEDKLQQYLSENEQRGLRALLS